MKMKDRKVKCQKCSKLVVQTGTSQKYCKGCAGIVKKEYDKKWHLKNKKKRKKQTKEWRENNPKYAIEWQRNNPKRILEIKERFQKNNPGYIGKYCKERKKTDKIFAIICRLRDRKNQAIKRAIKTGNLPRDFIFKGVKIDYKAILEVLKPYPKDISKYHIDEKFPYSKVDWNDKESIKKCFAPSNHQWLLARDNIRKGGKYETKK